MDIERRIGKENNDVIVRFTTFRHQALFYRNRKKLKNQNIHLDLTKSWLSLLTETRMLIENNKYIAFCYGDINYRCKLQFKNNDDFFFEALHILKSKYLAIQTIQTSESVLLMVIILILSHACVTIISF